MQKEEIKKKYWNGKSSITPIRNGQAVKENMNLFCTIEGLEQQVEARKAAGQDECDVALWCPIKEQVVLHTIYANTFK